MSTYKKRRGGLFPRSLGDVVKTATKPLMDKQGKLYGALLRDWPTIIGDERAQNTRPQKLAWPTKEASGAVLHLEVAAAIAPELQYEAEQILEKCARYFGYRAIERIVIHPSHERNVMKKEKPAKPAIPKDSTPSSMTDILARMRSRIAGDDKRE